MDKTEAYRKISEGIEALNDIGLTVRDADISQVPAEDQPSTLNELMQMGGAEPEMEDVLVFVAKPAGADEQEENDDGGGDDRERQGVDEDEAVEIDFSGKA